MSDTRLGAEERIRLDQVVKEWFDESYDWMSDIVHAQATESWLKLRADHEALASEVAELRADNEPNDEALMAEGYIECGELNRELATFTVPTEVREAWERSFPTPAHFGYLTDDFATIDAFMRGEGR